jgi:hypothetical protein
MAGQVIECDIEPARKLLGKLNAASLQTVLQAAGAGVRNAAIRHFRGRNSEPANSEGFPRFGQSYPKANFWSGVAKTVGEVTVQGDTATIAIDSPALAHKANPSPPVIKPKGGRKFLAIPANARAAAFAGMPRDFLGGDMRFGFAQTPDGATLPALLATRDHLRTVKKGKKAGQRLATAIDAQQTSGHGDVQYWLVRKVQTRHDPNALPADELLSSAASRAAQTALNQLNRE